MDILQPIRREFVKITANLSGLFTGEQPERVLVCPRCEQPMYEGHQCKQSAGMKRRMFLGLLGASSAALAMRIEGVPIPGARVEVIAYGGDAFEVETSGAFTVAWEGAKTRAGNPFKNDAGLIQDGGLLEFNRGDIGPEDALRIHRGIHEMRVLGVVDKATGKPVKYRIVRNEQVEARSYQLNQAKMDALVRMNPSGAWLINPGKGRTETLATAMPVDSKLVDRKGTGQSVVAFKDGSEFMITYKAGVHPDRDQVSWRRTKNPSWMAAEPEADDMIDGYDPYGRRIKQTAAFSGNLHQSIQEINRHHPDKSELIRKAIMSLNPEYQRRIAGVALTRVEKSGDEKLVAEGRQRLRDNHPAWSRRMFGRKLAGPKGVLPA